MSDDSNSTGKVTGASTRQASHFMTVLGTSSAIALIGLGALVLLLATPSVRFPDADDPNHCVRVASWGFNPSDVDVSGDRASSVTRDNCDLSRQERIATAIFVAIPTVIAGSVGTTALVFRRQLFGPGREPEQT